MMPRRPSNFPRLGRAGAVRRWLRRLFLLVLGLLGLSVALVLVFRWVPPPGTALMVERKIEAWRAGAWPRLAGSTQPMMTSDTSSGLTPACSIAALIAVAPRVGVGTPVNWPSMEPMAVRLAPTMTTSFMETPVRGGKVRLSPPSERGGKPANGRWRGAANDAIEGLGGG